MKGGQIVYILLSIFTQEVGYRFNMCNTSQVWNGSYVLCRNGYLPWQHYRKVCVRWVGSVATGRDKIVLLSDIHKREIPL